jgi:hypothetical protein
MSLHAVRPDGEVRPPRKENNVMSTIKTATTQASALAHVQALIAGTQKHFPNGQFTLGNTAYTTATLIQAFQSLADALNAVTAAHASVKDGVAALHAMDTKVAPLIRDYTSFLRATFSTATAQLGDFGVQALKARTPMPSDKRVVAVAKAKATRTARGTTSKKQKLAVKGDVTGVVVTPVTLPAPSSPPAAPVGPAPILTASGGATK